MSQQLGILQQGQSLQQQQQLAQQQQQESHPDQIQNPEPIPELPPDAVTSPAPGFPADPVKIEYILEQDRVVCDRAIAQALELYLAKDIGSAVDILVAAWKIINASCDDTRKVPLLDRLRVLANATEMSEHFEEQDFRFGAEPEFAKSLALIKLFVSRSVSRVVEHVFVSDGSFGLFLVEVLQKSLVDGATGVNLISDFLKDFASVITDLSKNSQIDRQEKNSEFILSLCKNILTSSLSVTFKAIFEGHLTVSLYHLNIARSTLGNIHPYAQAKLVPVIEDFVQVLKMSIKQ